VGPGGAPDRDRRGRQRAFPRASRLPAAGGLGLLIGDGTINYRTESILETYCACKLNPATTLALDYQFIADPAHNADRGPVSIFAFRGHA
jgi:high affinity Mn2+ porin